MDFNAGLYVFNGVPGYDASKSERIVNAIQKLQAKIKHLEQVRKSERETTSKETDTEEDLTFADIQYRLLLLQFKYIRAIVKNSSTDKSFSAYESKVASSENVQPENTLIENDIMDIQSQCKETQTGRSLCESYLPMECPYYIDSSTENKNNAECTTSHSQPPNFEKNTARFASSAKCSIREDQSAATSASVRDSQSHYHLKFDDVPFILGASSSASHNIVANVQNIIAMMKTHNKALCKPKTQQPKNSTAFSTQGASSDDTSKLLKNLTEDLTELQMKQAKLIEKLDNAQKYKHFVDSREKIGTSGFTEADKGNTKKHSRCNASSSNFYPKESRFWKSRHDRHAVPSNRFKANVAQVSRQRLLRSIQECKTQLSEEDLSWD